MLKRDSSYSTPRSSLDAEGLQTNHHNSRLCIYCTESPVEYNVQTPRFLGFEYVCATYNRGVAQDMVFNRVELAQPHEYSWPAAPYHANIPVRKSIRHKKTEP